MNVPYMPGNIYDKLVGGLASFSGLADGADRYEAYID